MARLQCLYQLDFNLACSEPEDRWHPALAGSSPVAPCPGSRCARRGAAAAPPGCQARLSGLLRAVPQCRVRSARRAQRSKLLQALGRPRSTRCQPPRLELSSPAAGRAKGAPGAWYGAFCGQPRCSRPAPLQGGWPCRYSFPSTHLVALLPAGPPSLLCAGHGGTHGTGSPGCGAHCTCAPRRLLRRWRLGGTSWRVWAR